MKSNLVNAMAQIVSSYIKAKPPSSETDLTSLMHSVYRTIVNLDSYQPNIDHVPAVPIKDSVKEDFLVCLECGEKDIKFLKTHLKNKHSMNVDEYKGKWSLPDTYPSVAPNTSRLRKKQAKEAGLGYMK